MSASFEVVVLAGELSAAAEICGIGGMGCDGEGIICGIGDMVGEGVEGIIGSIDGGDGDDGGDGVEGCTSMLWIAASVSACTCARYASACPSSMSSSSSSSLCTTASGQRRANEPLVSLEDPHELPLPGASGTYVSTSVTAAAPCTAW